MVLWFFLIFYDDRIYRILMIFLPFLPCIIKKRSGGASCLGAVSGDQCNSVTHVPQFLNGFKGSVFQFVAKDKERAQSITLTHIDNGLQGLIFGFDL